MSLEEGPSDKVRSCSVRGRTSNDYEDQHQQPLARLERYQLQVQADRFESCQQQMPDEALLWPMVLSEQEPTLSRTLGSLWRAGAAFAERSANENAYVLTASQGQGERMDGRPYGRLYQRKIGPERSVQTFVLEGLTEVPCNFLRYMLTELDITIQRTAHEKTVFAQQVIGLRDAQQVGMNVGATPIKPLSPCDTYMDREKFDLHMLRLFFKNREAVSFNVDAEYSDGSFVKTSQACSCQAFPSSSSAVRVQKTMYTTIRRGGPGMTHFQIYLQVLVDVPIPTFLLTRAIGLMSKHMLECWFNLYPEVYRANREQSPLLARNPSFRDALIGSGPYPYAATKNNSMYDGATIDWMLSSDGGKYFLVVPKSKNAQK